MTHMSKIRPFTHDNRGDAARLRRDIRGMDPMQMFREFVHNGIEAGAADVRIDGYRDPDTGHTLTRITDNGSGMTNRQLVEYLSTLDVRSKGADNYGVGARIAAVPTNPAGVTFATRTETTEGMVQLYEYGGMYGLRVWDAVDDDGDTVKAEVLAPEARMLSNLKAGETGTAVILHGNGKADTWTPSVAYHAHKFLADRYYDFPQDVTIHVRDDRRSKPQWRTVSPFGAALATVSDADGEIPFKDIAGLSGVMFWWTLNRESSMDSDRRQVASTPGGVGLVTTGKVSDDAAVSEIFNYTRSYSSDFGLIYKSVQDKVAILIWVDGAEMDTLRSSVVLPGDNRKNIPWKMLGAHFAQHMPPEIEELLSGVTVNTVSFDAEMARLLDEDWMKNLDPVKVAVPDKTGDENTGDEDGDAAPRGDDIGGGGGGGSRRRAAAKTSAAGDEPAKAKAKKLPPTVEFLEPDQIDSETGITWKQAGNVVQISTEFPPYVREVGRWAEKVNHARPVIIEAVRRAYGAEYAATIVDANAQSKHGTSPTVIDGLKSDIALYAKALGMQALTERVRSNLSQVAKDA